MIGLPPKTVKIEGSSHHVQSVAIRGIATIRENFRHLQLNAYNDYFSALNQVGADSRGLSSNHVKSAVKDFEIAVPVEPS